VKDEIITDDMTYYHPLGYSNNRDEPAKEAGALGYINNMYPFGDYSKKSAQIPDYYGQSRS
jgi:hypothetical protein